jgi:hypothetical protein
MLAKRRDRWSGLSGEVHTKALRFSNVVAISTGALGKGHDAIARSLVGTQPLGHDLIKGAVALCSVL